MKRPLWRLLWNSKREAAFDVGLVIGLHLLGRVLEALFPSETPPEAYDWVGGLWPNDLLMTGLLLSLLVRRRFPVSVMAFNTALSIAQVLLIEAGPGPLLAINQNSDPWIPGLTPWVIYAVAAYARGRVRQFFAWDMVAITTVLAVRPWEQLNGDVIVVGVVWTILPAVLGLYIGARRRLVLAWQERVERVEYEQELLTEQARADERTRLATEMHDVVTHRVSLMVLQAGALGIAANDPETRRAAEELRTSGCAALEELRDLVGVLRRGVADEDGLPDATPPTEVPDLTELIGQSEAVGVPVEFTVDGAAAMVSAAVGRTAYRVVQEALTNVHKHAFGARVSVHVIYSDDRLRLVIRNTEPPGRAAADLAGSGSGSGLLGLQQRVELVGGTFHAGRGADGGFELDVVLPAYVPTGEAVGDE
ncbi:sensor histidine kinase [Saccharopolyspora sp. ASAGF58]|uniref:sensor histidine kinase n=1 Tax=Saccharopolyspora sp. ASAGF58 TaxID=2719023 RepID=UPI0014401BA4|nr:histidine kinase [Saccharopolyspora sp. ASAGF58]QIZ36201.1 histidine kinase [Saccharopolyspora sp. ASAGF58]